MSVENPNPCDECEQWEPDCEEWCSTFREEFIKGAKAFGLRDDEIAEALERGIVE